MRRTCDAVLHDHQMEAAVDLKSIWKSQAHFFSFFFFIKHSGFKNRLTSILSYTLTFYIYLYIFLWYLSTELFIAVAVMLQHLHLNLCDVSPRTLLVWSFFFFLRYNFIVNLFVVRIIYLKALFFHKDYLFIYLVS